MKDQDNVAIENLTGKAKIRIHSKPKDVFAAFVNGKLMSKFWFTRSDEDLVTGETSTWSIGQGDDAFLFDVLVRELDPPHKIVIEWERGENIYAKITWEFEETDEGDTILRIEESGFVGNKLEIVNQALDSTGGFNQVIVAAKALIEHGVEINVVRDHV